MPVAIVTVDVPTAAYTQVSEQQQQQQQQQRRNAPQAAVSSNMPKTNNNNNNNNNNNHHHHHHQQTFGRTLTPAETATRSDEEAPIKFTRANSWSESSAINDAAKTSTPTVTVTTTTTTTTNINKIRSQIAVEQKTHSFSNPMLKEQGVKPKQRDGNEAPPRTNKTTTTTDANPGNSTFNNKNENSGCSNVCVQMLLTSRADLLDCADRQLPTLPCLHNPLTRLQHGSGNDVRWRVRMLRLSRNNLTSLEVPAVTTLPAAQPLALAAFSRVVMLDVTRNKITSLAGVEAMASLRVLLASHNQLEDLAPLFSVSSLLQQNGTLEVLDVSFNHIRDILPTTTTTTTPNSTTNSVLTRSLDRNTEDDSTEASNSLESSPVAAAAAAAPAVMPLRRLRTLNLSFNHLQQLDSVNMLFPDLEELRVVRNQLTTLPSSFPRRLSILILQQNYLTEDARRCAMELPQRMRTIKEVDVSKQRTKPKSPPIFSGFFGGEKPEKIDITIDSNQNHNNNSGTSSNSDSRRNSSSSSTSNSKNDDDKDEKNEESEEKLEEIEAEEGQTGDDENEDSGNHMIDTQTTFGTLNSVKIVKQQKQNDQKEQLQQEEEKQPLVFSPLMQNHLQDLVSTSSIVSTITAGGNSFWTTCGNSLECLPPHVLGILARLVASASLRPSKRMLDSYVLSFADSSDAFGVLAHMQKFLRNDFHPPRVGLTAADVNQADAVAQRRSLVAACIARSGGVMPLNRLLLKSGDGPWLLDMLTQMEQQQQLAWDSSLHTDQKKEEEEDDEKKEKEKEAFHSEFTLKFPAPRGKLRRHGGVYGRNWLINELKAPLRWSNTQQWHSVHGCCALQHTRQERIDRRRKAPVVESEVGESMESPASETLQSC